MSMVVTVTDENDAVVNLTGATVNLTIHDDGTAVYTDSNTSHTTPASGVTTFEIDKTDTADFPAPSLLRYEVEVTLSDGAKYTAIRDLIEVNQDKT